MNIAKKMLNNKEVKWYKNKHLKLKCVASCMVEFSESFSDGSEGLAACSFNGEKGRGKMCCRLNECTPRKGQHCISGAGEKKVFLK